MSVCYLGCDESLSLRIQNYPGFSEAEIIAVELPITASEVDIDLLVAGPAATNLERLTATVSDWNLPPATLCIIDESEFEQQVELLSHHPRVGRSIFFCKNTPEAIQTGLDQTYAFYQKRASLNIDNSISGNYTTNNISPRWLFQTIMEHLDEYIYFKDGHSKFLAVSRYLAESCGKKEPSDVLGLCDFDLFDQEHAQEAYSDERKIATGELDELYKEEQIFKNGQPAWVASRKLPLHTRSNYLAGSFGLSRDITEAKELHQKLEENHERMHAELLLARNLQDTLIQQKVPEFLGADGCSTLQIASKYIPSFHLSGDFFSVIKTDQGGAAILVADVMGHGVRAAMVTAMIQIAVHQLRSYATQPAEFMTRLNEMMQRTMQPSGQTMFATAVYSYIDLESKQLTYVQAGARHGIHVPAEQTQDAAIFNSAPISPALGLLPETRYTEAATLLKPGDEIVLYTDGIVEAAIGDEEYSEARLIDFLMEHRRETLPAMVDELLKSVQTFTHSKELDDDVCLIALRIPE
jgi:sigma-B regulation protein RsbU (phosphoserine phosphatase)